MRQLTASRPGAPAILWRLLRRLARESPALLLVASASAVLQSALLIPIAVLVRHVFDTEISRRHGGSIVFTGLAILALYTAAAALGYVARAAALRTAARLMTTLRIDLLAKLLTLSQQWHDRKRMAAVQAIVAQDTERVESMLAAVGGNLIPAIVVGGALIVAALIISPILFVTGLVVVPPLMFATRLMARHGRNIAEQWSESSRRFSAYSHLLLRAIVTTRIVGGEQSVLARAIEPAREASERRRQLGQAGARFSAMENAIGAAAGTAVLIVGGIAVTQHSTTIGDLLAFYAVLGLLLRQLNSVGWQTGGVLIGIQSLRDIDGVLAIEEAEPYLAGRRRIDYRGGIGLQRVSFSYTDVPVVHDLTLSIEPGEHVAVIGPNGAGKSTLVSLLLGLYAPDSGQLYADEIPYDQLDIRSLRRQIGVVLQDPVLLPGTIRENIAYGRPEASDAAVEAAAEAATATQFIEQLPQRYGTAIGDEGTGLSGGQRQRIAVARALLGRPSLLVLDEPSTYLDDDAVAMLTAGLVSLPQAPTLLLVTHDPQVSVHVERVLELRDGRILGDTRSRPRIGAAQA